MIEFDIVKKEDLDRLYDKSALTFEGVCRDEKKHGVSC